MRQRKCPNCGGSMHIEEQQGVKVLSCEFCGTTVDLPASEQPRKETGPQQVVIQIPEINTGQMRQTTAGSSSSSLGCIITLIVLVGVGAALAIGGFASGLSDEIQDTVDNIQDSVAGNTTETVDYTRRFAELDTPGDFVVQNDQYVVGGSVFGDVIIWDAETGGRLHVLERISGLSDIYIVGDEVYFITGSVEVYNLETGNRVRTFGSRYRVAALSPNQETLGILDYDNNAMIVNTSGSVLARLPDGGLSNGFAIGFSPDGNLLGISGPDAEFAMWYVPESRLVYSGEIGMNSSDQFVFSPDSSQIVFTDSDELRFFEVSDTTFAFRRTLEPEADGPLSIQDMAFSPDGNLLALGDFFGGAHILDIEAEELTYQLEGDGGVNGVIFSADGTRVFGMSNDSHVYEWELPQ